MLADLLTDPVTFKKSTWANVGGVRTASLDETPAMASVQPMRGSRRQLHGIAAADRAITVYLDADPGLKVDDLVVAGDATFQVIAPARDEAGRGEVWSLDCVQRQ